MGIRPLRIAGHQSKVNILTYQSSSECLSSTLSEINVNSFNLQNSTIVSYSSIWLIHLDNCTTSGA